MKNNFQSRTEARFGEENTPAPELIEQIKAAKSEVVDNTTQQQITEQPTDFDPDFQIS